MTEEFNNVVFSVFEYGDFNTLANTVKEICQKRIEEGKAEFHNDAVNIMEYYNPDIGSHLPEKFACWKSEHYPDRIFFISNFGDGWHTMCRAIQKRLRFSWAMFEMSDINSCYSMNLFLYSKRYGVERSVFSHYDDTHWVFCEDGEPIDIENLDYYKVRLRKNRVNKEIIMEYMRRLGINFYDIDKDITHYLNFIQTRW